MPAPLFPPARPTWDEFYMQLADAYAARSSCPRAAVGAVLVGRNKRPIGFGYNGAPAGTLHCLDVGCYSLEGSNSCVRAIHAETNAVLAAMAAAPHQVLGGTLYVTHQPCWTCTNLIAQVGVDRVVYAQPYHAAPPLDYVLALGMELERWNAN